MIKRISQLVAALALCLAAATPALARGYIGVSAVYFDHSITVPGISDKGHSTGVMVQVGTNVNEYLALETRFGATGTGHFSKIAASQSTTLFSILIRGQLPLSDTFRVYALLGDTNGQATPSGSITGSANRDSLSYGGGIQAHGVRWSGSVEWMRYWDRVNVGPGIDLTIDGIAATLGYAF